MNKHKFLNHWLDIIFPRRCPVCDDVLKYRSGLIHLKCQKKLIYISEPTCMQCGKPIDSYEVQYCTDCGRQKHLFTRGKALWVYDETMGKSIAKYKYGGRQEYGEFYAKELLSMHSSWIKSLKADVIIPVPLHWKKQRDRGYNQAAIVAKCIGKALDIPVDTRYLKRKDWTEPQKELSPMERYNNLKRAFRVDTKGNTYKHIILVDDIYTTGSTIDACTKILKDAGATNVYFLSICIGSDREG